MTEHIILYHISDLTAPIILARDAVYAERYTKYQDHYIAFVDAWIFSPLGKVILQRRAKHKKVSPNLLHTTIGGHLNPGEDIGFTLIHECMEEFGHASYIVPDSMAFDAVYGKLAPYNDRVVILQQLRQWSYEFEHHVGEEVFLSRDMCHDFVGVFSGIPKNLDSSVSEFVTLSLEEIDEKMKDRHHDFTNSFQAKYALLRSALYEFRDAYLV